MSRPEPAPPALTGSIASPLGLKTRLVRPEYGFDPIVLFDVLLIAVLFLALGSRFIHAPGVTVNLPVVQERYQSSVAAVEVLTVKSDQILLYRGYLLSPAELASLVSRKGYRAPTPDAVLLVKLDRTVSAQTLLRIGELARQAGYGQIQIAAEPPPQARQP